MPNMAKPRRVIGSNKCAVNISIVGTDKKKERSPKYGNEGDVEVYD